MHLSIKRIIFLNVINVVLFSGARFAVYQTKVGLIKILLNYKVEVCEKTQIPYINDPTHPMMLMPNHGIHAKLIKLDK